MFKNLQACVITKIVKTSSASKSLAQKKISLITNFVKMKRMEIETHKISYKMIAHSQGLERQQQIWVCRLEWETKSPTTQFKAFTSDVLPTPSGFTLLVGNY